MMQNIFLTARPLTRGRRTSRGRWQTALGLALGLLTCGTAHAQTAPAIGTTSFTGIPNNTFYVNNQPGPATVSNLASFGWDFTATSVSNGNVSILARSTNAPQGALGGGDPGIITSRGGASDTYLATQVKANDGSSFKLNSVYLTVGSAPQAARDVTLTGYKAGVAVSGATLTQNIPNGASSATWRIFNVASNAAFQNVDAFGVTVATPAGVTLASIGVDEIAIAAPVSPATAPTVTTATPSAITAYSATLGGNVTADGGATITERGVVYMADTGTPTTANTKLTATGTTGAFTANATGLSAGTAYAMRAFATNSTGTSYGSAVSFTTAAGLATTGSQTNVNCFGSSTGSYAVSATGGSSPYTYAYSPSGGTTATASNLAAGNYTVTVTDAAGATNTRSFTISQPAAALATTLSSRTDVACNGGRSGAATVSVSGGTSPYTYSWNTSPVQTTATATGLNAGTYTLTVTDANACTTTRSVTISQPASAVGGTAVITNVSTNGGSDGRINLTPSGGTSPYTYNWGGGITFEDRTGLSAGTYTVVITDTNGCTASLSFTVTQPAASATAAPVLTSPANNGIATTTTPTYQGTAVAGSTVTVYVDGSSIGTTTATSGGAFSFAQPTALSQGSHSAYATATASGSAVSANSSTSTFTVDSVAPTVAVSSSTAANNGSSTNSPYAYTATFSEAVTGFAASKVTVANGTISNFTGSGTTYTFNITPTFNSATVQASVAANQAQDVAGNGNTASNTYAITYYVQDETWTGATSTDWGTAGNWSANVVPTTSLNVTIPAAPANQPVVSGTQTARNVTVAGGASLTLAANAVFNAGPLGTGGATYTFLLASGSTLTQGAGSEMYLAGDLTNNGATFALNATSEIGFGGLPNVAHTIGGTAGITFQTLNLGEQGNGDQLTIQVPVQVRRVLQVFNNSTVLASSTGGSLTLLSDATGTALLVNTSGGTVAGTVTMQRYIDPSANAGAGYRHYAAPVSNTTLADLATTGYAPEISQAATYNSSATPGTTTPFPTLFSYDQSRLASATNNYSAFDKGFVVPTSLNAAMSVGQGYVAQIGSAALVDFVGTPTNGDQAALTLSRGPNAAAGWQLVGNPYPAPLDYSLVAAADRTGLDAATYVVQSTGPYTGGYRSFVNGQSTTGTNNPLIASSQGFWVRVSSGSTTGSLTFRQAQRVTSFASQAAFQRSTADARPALRLALAGHGLADAWVAYAEAGATPAFDSQFDAAKLPNGHGLNLSSAAGAENLAIDGRPAFTPATSFALALGVPAAGTYSLSAAAIDNLPAGLTAYLLDAATGTTTALAVGSSYSFSVTAAQAQALVQGRFSVSFSAASPLATAPAALAAQVTLYPNPATEQVAVALPGIAGASTVRADVLNALGQLVLRRTASLPAAGTTLTLPTSELAAGVYTVRLSAGSVVLTKRLTIQ